MWERILAIAIVTISGNALALSAEFDRCDNMGEVCTEGPSTKVINGVPVTRACWKWRVDYRCLPKAVQNHCSALQAQPECHQISSSCSTVDPVTGICIRHRNVYRCNAAYTGDEVVELPPTYTVVRDEEVSTCGPNEQNPNCQVVKDVCVEPGETRIINGYPVYKDCWKREKEYACFTGGDKTDCGELPNKCQHLYDTCLSEDDEGNCLTTEKTYKCVGQSGSTPGGGQQQCEDAVYCIAGDCETFTRNPNQDFHKAITWLSALKGMADEFDEGTLSVFKGEHMECGVTIVGFSNCCKDSGWGSDIGLAECSEEELMLAEKMQARLGVYVGTYCDKKVLGVCVEKKRSYCVFSSRLGRIINEQGRPQLGRGWGAPKSPDCAGLTINDLQSIDFSQIDLMELYIDVQASIPDVAATTQEMTNRIRSRYE